MQLLAREVSADYYTRPPGIASLFMLTITYIHRVGSTTIQRIACIGSEFQNKNTKETKAVSNKPAGELKKKKGLYFEIPMYLLLLLPYWWYV